MAVRNWSGKNGLWSDPTQWSGGLPGTVDVAVFPTGTYTAQFATTANVVQVSGGTSATLDFQSGQLTLTGSNGNDGNWFGLLAQSGGTIALPNDQFTVNGTFTQTGGTVTTGAGTRLNIQGSATLGGQIAGQGTLGIGGSVTLADAGLAIGALVMATTGTLTLAGDESYNGDFMPAFGRLVLGGHDLTLSGQSAIGNISVAGPGTLTVSGTALFAGLSLSGSGGSIIDTGLIVNDSGLGLPPALPAGVTGTVSVAPGGVYDLATDNILTGSTADAIVNAGLFEKTAGVAGATSNIQVPLINTGTLRSTIGTMLLTGQGDVLGGTLDGAGVIRIGGTATLTPDVALNVWQLGVGFGGLLELTGTTVPNSNLNAGLSSTIALQGNTLITQGAGTLGSTILAGTAASPGSLFVGGVYDVGGLIVTGGTLWLEDKGRMVQSGQVVLGLTAADHVAFQIDAGSVYEITTDDSAKIFTFVGGGTASAAILNNGLFENDGGGSGLFRVDTPFANNNSGTIVNAAGNMLFAQSFINDGVGTLAGNVHFAGGIQASSGGHFGTLEIAPNATVTIDGTVNAKSTLDFQGGPAALLVLNSPGLFSGTIDHFGPGQTIDLVNMRANTYAQAGDIYSFAEVFNGTTNQVASITLDFPAGFALTGDGHGGTELLAVPPTAVFPGLTTAATAISWSGGTAVAEWDNGLGWSSGTAPNVFNDVNIGNVGTMVYGQDPLGQSTGTVDMLTAGGTELDLSSGNLFVNAGGGWGGNVIETGGEFVSVTGFSFSGATYTLSANARLISAAGVLNVNDTTFLADGTLTGSGEIAIGGTMIASSLALINVGSLDIRGQAAFNGSHTLASRFQLDSGQLRLQGGTLTLTGLAALHGALIDPGTVAIASTGTADVSGFSFGTVDVLSVAGFAYQTSGDLNATANGAISIAAGATYDIQTDDSIFLAGGQGALVNAGLLEKTGGSGKTTFEANVVSTGTFLVQSGTIGLAFGALDAGGTISGGGTLSTANGGSGTSLTLESGTFINIAGLVIGNTVLKGDQTYLGSLTASGSVTLQGHTFSLGGSAELGGFIAGGGQLNLSHSADLNALTVSGAGTAVYVTGIITQSGNVALGGSTADSVTLAVSAAGVYDDLVDGNIFGNFGGSVVGTIANAGLFEKTGGSGNSTISAALTNTGTLADAQATLTLSGPVLNDALITVAGELVENAGIGADAGAVGNIVLGPAGTLVANGAIAASQTIVYDPGGLIQIAQLSNFDAAINGFAAGDRIELLNNVAVTSVGYSGNAIMLNGTNGVVGTIAATNLPNPTSLTVSSDGSDTFITSVIGRTLSWTGTGGDAAFGDPGNWNDLSNALNPAQSAPAAMDTVDFDTAGGAITGSGSMAATQVGSTDSGALRMTGGATLVTGLLDAGVIASAVGQIDLSGTVTKLLVTGSATVGDGGTGGLSVSNGATVAAASLTIGALNNSSGAVVVSGTGSTVNVNGGLIVGERSSGSLNMANGAIVTAASLTIGSGAAGSGNVVIGPGSHLTLTGTIINVGLAGSGVLDVQGGTLSLVTGTTLSPGTFGRIVQVGGLIDPAAVFDASGGSFGGGGTAEASVEILNTSLATVSGLAETLLAPLITSGDTANIAGVWSVKSGGTLVLDANSVDNSQTIQFGDATGELVIGQQVTLDATQTPQTIAASALSGFAAPIVGYKTGDTIAFSGLAVASDQVTGNVVTLFDAQNDILGTLTFQIAKGGVDNAAAVAAAAQIACFAAGTLIETATGPRAVETLCVGDRVVTNDGAREPVVWIGRRVVDCAWHPRPATVWPVRVSAGAFWSGIPGRDLYLSPDHAVFMNDVLLPVRLLINGTTITQVKRDRVVYHHVELPEHAVILAEGLTVESYLDVGDRANYDDGVTIRLLPDFAARLAPEPASVWETNGAAPLVTTGEKLVLAQWTVMENVPRSRSRSVTAQGALMDRLPGGSREPVTDRKSRKGHAG